MNYKMKLSSAFVFGLLSLFVISCDQNEPNDPNTPLGIEPGPVVTMGAYPLEVGNEWMYTMTVDASGAETLHFDYVVGFTVISDTVINGMTCQKVRSTETEGTMAGLDRLGYRYLTHSNFGLDMVAYNGPSSQVFFRLTEEVQIPNYSMVDFAQSTLDSVVVMDSALHYMRFPSVEGDIWRSNEFGSNSGAEFKRTWAGYYTVTTTAGSFDCIRLDMFGDSDQDFLPDSGSILIQQYISPEFGLIKEVHTHELHWVGGVTGDYLRELTLTSVNVQ